MDISLAISSFALVISALTFWLTRIRKGTLKMTRPTLICFIEKNGSEGPKVFIRTLLYSTSDQGHYVQNMFIRLSRAGRVHDFNVWAYGDNSIVRGSGLYISKGGVACYHHFLLPKDEQFSFLSGEYIIDIFAETPNKKQLKIFETTLTLTVQQANDLLQGDAIYFNWASNTQRYTSHTETKKETN